MQAGKIVYGTAVASTSGTSKDFTGIPSWAKRVTLRYDSVGKSSSSFLRTQLGTGGTPTTTGYNSSTTDFNGVSQGGASDTGGFNLSGTIATTGIYNVTWIFERFDASSNTWFCHGMFNTDASAQSGFVHGTVTLSGALNMVRATMVDGTSTFNAGSMCISWE